jgi:hypothetical protein
MVTLLISLAFEIHFSKDQSDTKLQITNKFQTPNPNDRNDFV